MYSIWCDGSYVFVNNIFVLAICVKLTYNNLAYLITNLELEMIPSKKTYKVLLRWYYHQYIVHPKDPNNQCVVYHQCFRIFILPSLIAF